MVQLALTMFPVPSSAKITGSQLGRKSDLVPTRNICATYGWNISTRTPASSLPHFPPDTQAPFSTTHRTALIYNTPRLVPSSNHNSYHQEIIANFAPCRRPLSQPQTVIVRFNTVAAMSNARPHQLQHSYPQYSPYYHPSVFSVSATTIEPKTELVPPAPCKCN